MNGTKARCLAHLTRSRRKSSPFISLSRPPTETSCNRGEDNAACQSSASTRVAGYRFTYAQLRSASAGRPSLDDERNAVRALPYRLWSRTPSPCFRAIIRKASCLTGSLRRKAWGDKAGRKGPSAFVGCYPWRYPASMSLSAKCKKGLDLLARPKRFELLTPR